MPFPSWCTEHPLPWPHEEMLITWRVTLRQMMLSVNSQAPTHALSKSPDDPSWNSNTCYGETVHRSYGKQLFGHEENKLCTVRRVQGCPVEMERRMDRNSTTVLLAALFQCFSTFSTKCDKWPVHTRAAQGISSSSWQTSRQDLATACSAITHSYQRLPKRAGVKENAQ